MSETTPIEIGSWNIGCDEYISMEITPRSGSIESVDFQLKRGGLVWGEFSTVVTVELGPDKVDDLIKTLTKIRDEQCEKYPRRGANR